MVYQPTAKCSMRQLTVALHYAVFKKSHRRRRHPYSDPQLLRRELNGGTGLAMKTAIIFSFVKILQTH